MLVIKVNSYGVLRSLLTSAFQAAAEYTLEEIRLDTLEMTYDNPR